MHSQYGNYSTFTLFLARLTEALGAVRAAGLLHEFNGQTISIPASNPTLPIQIPGELTPHFTHDRALPSPSQPRSDEDATHVVMRRVSERLTVKVNGIEYDVSHVPGAVAGQLITVNPKSPPRIQPVNPNHLPLSLEEAKAISQRLLASARWYSAATQSAPSLGAETHAMDANCTAHLGQYTTPQCTPDFPALDSEQVLHRPLS